MSTPRPTRDRIVVGIDSTQSSRYAVLWAAEEARIRRCSLVITHIDPAPGASPGTGGVGASRTVLDLSAAAASLRQPGVPVGTLLLSGSVSDELTRLSRTSSLLVVGLDRAVPRAAHGARGSVEDRVVTQSDCPVVVVPGRPRVDDAQHHHIVSGWTGDEAGRRSLEVAVSEAALRHASLHIVSLVAVPSSAAPRPSSPFAVAVAELTRQHPDLRVSAEESATPGLGALLRHAEQADLAILASSHSTDRWSIGMGFLAGWAMREARCPVMLTGVGAATPSAAATGAARSRCLAGS
jgi:nucleotide-binding universal stress UspA family protein